MGLFDSKATRIAKHRELIEFARVALDTLKVGHRVKSLEFGQVVEPVWRDGGKSVPLEFRSTVAVWVEDLVYQLHDSDMHEHLGDREHMRNLAESVAGVRACLAGLPADRRAMFRADTFARLLRQLEEDIAHRSEDLLNPFTRELSDHHLQFIGDCREAGGWFRSDDELRAANALRSIANRAEYPDLQLNRMRDAIAQWEALAEKSKAAWADLERKRGDRKPTPTRTADETQQGSRGRAPISGAAPTQAPVAEALRQLDRLKAEALITETEYQAKRAEILARL